MAPEKSDLLNPGLVDLLSRPNFAHVSTLMADGSPHSAAVWVNVEDGRPVFYKELTAVAYRNLKRDPRLAISVVDTLNPYSSGHLRGRVLHFTEEPTAGKWLADRALDYTSSPFPADKVPGPGALITVEVERSGYLDASYLKHNPRA